MKKICILFLILAFFRQSSFAQDKHLIDSLEAALKIALSSRQQQIQNRPPQDTTAADLMYALSKAYWANSPDKAMDYARQTLELSERLAYKKGIANAYSSMGVINWYKGNYPVALAFHRKALNIRETIRDKKGIAGSNNNIGILFDNMGNYPEALRHYFLTLKIYEDIGDKQNTALAYTNIGNVYNAQGNYSEALKIYRNALEIFNESGDKKYIAIIRINLGNTNTRQGNYAEALPHYQAALKLNEDLGNKYGSGYAYQSLGNLFTAQNNYSEALKYLLASLKIREEIKDKNGVAESCLSIESLYMKQKKYREAAAYLQKAWSLANELGNLQWMKECFKGMAVLDSVQGNFKDAWGHYRLYIMARDSLVNNENTRKTVQLQMQYDFDKKESLKNAEQEKRDALTAKELQKQKLERNGFIGGFAVVLFFAGVFFNQRNKIKNGKKRSDELLLNILPGEVAEELKATGRADAKLFDSVTVMFTDFKNFTQISEKLSPAELVAEIDSCFRAFDHIAGKHNIEKIKTIGDSYMCAGGLPMPNKTNAIEVVAAALKIQQFMLRHFQQRLREGKEPFEIRIGIHTGPVVAGIVGVKKFAYDIWGDTVNIASRMESSGEAGKINISGSTYALVKDEFKCIPRGKIQAKNKGGIDMYFVESLT